jgi:xylulokinase
MRPTYIGLDLGTGSLKALAADAAGQALAVETASYEALHPLPGWIEQRPEDWWAGACAATQRLLARPELAGYQAAGLGLSGQMHGVTLLDAEGQVLRPSLIWADSRGAAELAAFAERLPAHDLLAITGSLPSASSTLAKLLWVREHEPMVFARVGRIVLAKDELRRRLTGVLATDASDASGTLLFDIRRRAWSDAVLAALELDPALLPPVCASTSMVGHVSHAASDATGLPAGLPVVAGGGDAECAALGVGLGDDRAHVGSPDGDLLVSLGTAGQVLAVIDQPVIDPSGRVHTLCYLTPDRWHLMGAILSAGYALEWLDRACGKAPGGAAQLLVEAATAPPGAHGLLCLPYLLGERSPHMDPAARGAFVGLRAVHSRAHLARATVEGVAFALRDSLEVFRELGVTPRRLLLAGGAARDPLWRQVVADALALPVAMGPTEHASALGAARLAASAFGQETAPPGPTPVLTQPDPRAVQLYRRLYPLYRSLYAALRPTFAGLASLEGAASAPSPGMKPTTLPPRS